MSNQPKRSLADMLQDLDDLPWDEPVPGGFVQVPALHGEGCRWVPEPRDPPPLVLPTPPPPATALLPALPTLPAALPAPPPPATALPPPLPYLTIPPPAVRRTHPTGVVPDDDPPRGGPSQMALMRTESTTARQDLLRASTTSMQAAIQAWSAVIGRELDADEIAWLSSWSLVRNESGRRMVQGSLFVTQASSVPFRAVACQGSGTASSEYYVVLYVPADACPRSVRMHGYENPILSMLAFRDEILRRGYSAGPNPGRVWPGFPARNTLPSTETILGARGEDWRLLFEGGLDLMIQRIGQRQHDPVFPTVAEPEAPAPIPPPRANVPISTAFGPRRNEDRRRVALTPERRREIAAILNSDDDENPLPPPTGSTEFIAPQPAQRVLRIPVAPKPDDA